MMVRRLLTYGETLDEGQGANQHCPLGRAPLSITVSPTETPLRPHCNPRSHTHRRIDPVRHCDDDGELGLGLGR